VPELISVSTQKARKNHRCNLCNRVIEKGETYRRQFIKDSGDTYSFKEHDKCGEIANYLWAYIDPDEGMTEESFTEGCGYYCQTFVCPHCEHWDKSEDEECSKGHEYCLDKILERLKQYGLKKDGYKWIEFKRQEEATNEK
jgi:hypothetical protein